MSPPLRTTFLVPQQPRHQPTSPQQICSQPDIFSLTDIDESQPSQSLLRVDTSNFTMVGRAHDGRGTSNPRDTTVQAIAPTTILTCNTFDALAPDDDDSLDVPPPPSTMVLPRPTLLMLSSARLTPHSRLRRTTSTLCWNAYANGSTAT